MIRSASGEAETAAACAESHLRDLATPDAPTELHHRAVERALRHGATHGPASPHHDALAAQALADGHARAWLAAELLAALADLRRHLCPDAAWPADAPTPSQPTPGAEMPWDEGLARWLEDERWGKEGRDAAVPVRRHALDAARSIEGRGPAALWARWVADPGDVSSNVALVALLVWRRRGRTWFERKQRRGPAVPLPLLEAIEPLHRPGTSLTIVAEQGTVVADRGGRIIAAFDDRAAVAGVPVIDADALRRILPLGVADMGSLTGHRFVRWLFRATAEAALDGAVRPELRVPGGIEELAGLIGGPDCGDAREALRRLIPAFAGVSLRLPDGAGGNLYMYWYDPAPHQPVHLRITPNDPLLPDFQFQYAGASRRGRQWSHLVPVVPLPRLMGARRMHAAQASLQMQIVAELARDADQLVTHGGVQIPGDRMREIAALGGLGDKSLANVLDAWPHDADDGPAVLAVVERDRYHLAERTPWLPARQLLEDLGRRKVQGRAGRPDRRRRKT